MLLVGMQHDMAVLEDSLPWESAIPSLGIYSKGLKKHMPTQTPVHGTIKNWKQLNCNLGDNWVNYMEPISTMLYLFLKIYFSCMCMSVCSHACVHNVHACCPQNPEEGARSLGIKWL